MFDSENEYKIATQDAQVNTYSEKNNFKGKILLWNFFLLASFSSIGYFGFNYLKEETTLLSNNKTSVMGVSYTKSDSEYLEMMNRMDVDHLNQKSLNLENAMGNLVNNSVLRDKSLYTQAISKEIDGTYYPPSKERDDIYHKNTRVFLVKKGDTLASISEEFYGNSMMFDKIIKANKNLDKESQIIHIGQKLNVPY
jgi:hypothetical protein